MVTLNGSCADYRCESTDTKPEDAGNGALLLEEDTGDFYYFDGTEWKKVGWKVVGGAEDNE